MSGFNKQNRLDEKAVSVISDYFMNKHGDMFDLQFHGVKDNTPDTDGFLRLRESVEKMKGSYLNNVVFFQLKGFGKDLRGKPYISSRKLINFCKEINLPTILFVVANINEDSEVQTGAQIYWYYFSNLNVEILNVINKTTKENMKIPDLRMLRIGKDDWVDQFYQQIKSLSKKMNFLSCQMKYYK